MTGLFCFLFGSIIGSFLNVCIYRLPRNMSIVFPASHCPYCKSPLKLYDLFPVAGFLLLKGRCRYCNNKISWRYPFVEIITGSLFWLVYLYIGCSLLLIPYLFLASFLIVVSFIDIDFYLIPDKVIAVGFSAGFLFIGILAFISMRDAFLGFLLGGGSLLLMAVLSKGGMGGGDIKLASLIGLFLGWQYILVTIYTAAFMASAVGLILVAAKKKNRKDVIPFGPFLAVGAEIALIFGNRIIELITM